MGGRTIENKAEKVANIQLQTSSYGLAIPVYYGTNRGPANLLWFGAFTAIPHTEKTSSGGKGIGKVTQKNTTYTYTAAAIMALGEGPIAGIGAVWKDKDKTTLGALGLTLFTGTPTQSIWSFLTGWNISGNWAYDQAFGYAGQSASFTDQAINYSSTAYLAASAYDLGDQAQIPNHNFEIQGKLIYGSGIVDANPAAIIPDMLTSEQYGVGFASGQVDALASYSTYCRAAGLFMSPAYVDQEPAADCIKALCDVTNSAPVWSGGLLKVVPYGDTAITGNGATYTPDLTPLFDLTDDHFQDKVNPVRVKRSTPADAFNRFTLEFLNRANQYNVEIVTTEDQDAIEKYGLKPAPVIVAHMICDSATAKFAVELVKQRTLYKRNEYSFELDARYPMLEPMDIVTLTDPGQSMTRLPVRLLSCEEQDNGFALTAEDLPVGVANAARYTHDNGLRWQSIVNTPCQNAAAPIIFEMPADPTATGLSVAIAVGGQTTDPLYGGCRVWLSLDGTNYKAEGIIYGSSRYGLTTATLASHASGSDTTSTLSVALRSNGQLDSGSAADVAKGTTLIKVGDEYVAYQTATLTGALAYNLTTLNRGLYGTPTGSKGTSTPWVRVDDAIAILKDLDLTLIGQTVHIKLTAFNSYAAAEQDLASVSAYTYTITGDMHALKTPVDFLTGVSGAEKPANNATRNVYRGVWTSLSIGTAFVIGDEAVDQNSTWVSLTAHTKSAINGPPTLPTTTNTDWALRSKVGDAGATGFSSATVKIYKRSASSPALPTTTATYTFATGGLTGQDNGWTSAVPADNGNPLWVSVAGASSQGATDTIAAGEWVSPVIESQSGAAGSSGLNTAVAFIYQRTATSSAPTLPSVSTTYTFATGVTSGLDNGWTSDLPASGGIYRWRAQAGAAAAAATDTILSTEWATPQLIAQDGAGGAAGANGFTVSPASQAFTVACTANGTPKSGEFSKVVTFKVLQGSTDISDDGATTYSTSNTNVTATLGGTNGKVLTITAMGADTGKAVVTVQRSAVTIAVVEVNLTKAKDGFGSISQSDTSLTITNSSSYGGANGGPITLSVGPNGTVALDANVNYSTSGSLSKLAGKMQYRTTPGSGGWTDIGSEVQDSFGAQAGEPSTLSVSQSIAGPSTATNWEFQFINRRYSGSSTLVVDTGDFTVGWSGA